MKIRFISDKSEETLPSSNEEETYRIVRDSTLIEVDESLVPIIMECENIISCQVEDGDEEIVLKYPYEEGIFSTEKRKDLFECIFHLNFFDYLRIDRLLVRESLFALNIISPPGEDNSIGIEKFRKWMLIEDEFKGKHSFPLIKIIGDTFLEEWNNPRRCCSSCDENPRNFSFSQIIRNKIDYDEFSLKEYKTEEESFLRGCEEYVFKNEIIFLFAREYFLYLFALSEDEISKINSSSFDGEGAENNAIENFYKDVFCSNVHMIKTRGWRAISSPKQSKVTKYFYDFSKENVLFAEALTKTILWQYTLICRERKYSPSKFPLPISSDELKLLNAIFDKVTENFTFLFDYIIDFYERGVLTKNFIVGNSNSNIHPKLQECFNKRV